MKKLDPFHYHEVLDRAVQLAEYADSALSEHPVVKKHRKLQRLVETAVSSLHAVAQELVNTDPYVNKKVYKNKKS